MKIEAIIVHKIKRRLKKKHFEYKTCSLLCLEVRGFFCIVGYTDSGSIVTRSAARYSTTQSGSQAGTKLGLGSPQPSPQAFTLDPLSARSLGESGRHFRAEERNPDSTIRKTFALVEPGIRKILPVISRSLNYLQNKTSGLYHIRRTHNKCKL